MSTENSSNLPRATDTHWWEFYAVRYAMGTVVGAVIFYFLCLATPRLKPLLLLQPNDYLIGVERLPLLFAYGLTYCYIASGPVLVLHATRHLIDWRTRRVRRATIAVLSIGVIFASLVELLLGSTNVHWFVSWAAVFAFTCIALSQLLLTIATILQPDLLYAFYRRLATRRTAERTDIVESYRHLREHGNSFAIVFFEIALSVILFVVGTPGTAVAKLFEPGDAVYGYLIVGLFWIVPSVLVWFIATGIERMFAD